MNWALKAIGWVHKYNEVSAYIGSCGKFFLIEPFSLSSGNEKHDLHVTPQQGSSEPIVQDLAQVVEEATGVPLPFQKLIFKGRHFSSSFEPLWLNDLFKIA